MFRALISFVSEVTQSDRCKVSIEWKCCQTQYLFKSFTSYSSQEPLSDHTQEPLSDHTQEPLSDHTQIWKFKKTKQSLFYILSLYYLYPYKAWWCPFGPKHVTCSMWICFCNKCLVIFDFFFHSVDIYKHNGMSVFKVTFWRLKLNPEERSSLFLRNISMYLYYYMVQLSKRPRYVCLFMLCRGAQIRWATLLLIIQTIVLHSCFTSQ
jgi:hypothetical protein